MSKYEKLLIQYTEEDLLQILCSLSTKEIGYKLNCSGPLVTRLRKKFHLVNKLNDRYQIILAQYPNQQDLINLLSIKTVPELKILWNCSRKLVDNLRERFNLPNKNSSWKDILKKYESKQDELINLLETVSEVELSKKWNCGLKPIKTLRRKLSVKQDLHLILSKACDSRRKWDKIINRYPNQQELIALLKSTPYAELPKLWNCHVDTVYTICKKLGIEAKRTNVDEFLKEYSKEQLEDLYFNKYDRRLWKMAEELAIHQTTLSQIFDQLQIKQDPHTLNEVRPSGEYISQKAKERAQIKNPISNILNSPDWHENAVQVRKDNGSYTSPEYRAKISKKHVEVLERGEHKFKNTDIELALQAELTKRGIIFIQDKGLIDLTVPDMFIEPNIAVYADGDYWHSLPKAKVKDPYINEGLRRANYKVFRFLGSDIKKDVVACVDQIEAYINEQKTKEKERI